MKKGMKGDGSLKDYEFEGCGVSGMVGMLGWDGKCMGLMEKMVNGERDVECGEEGCNVGVGGGLLC